MTTPFPTPAHFTDSVPTVRPATGPDPDPRLSPCPDPTPRPDRGPLIQRLLLAAGAFCVLVAATVYLAVSWRSIGVTGQAGIALGVSGLAAAATHLLVRRGLRASAETFAAVTAGLLALDLAGAHHLDVLDVARLPWWTWLTAASGVVLVVSATLARLERLTAYRVVAVAALAFLPGAGAAALHAAGLDLAPAAVAGAGMAVAMVLLGIAARTSRRDAVAGGVAAVAAAGWWVVAAGAGLVAATSRHLWTDVVPTMVTWTLAMVVLLELTRRVIAAGRSGDNRRVVVSVAAPLAATPAPFILVVAAAHAGIAAMVAVAALAAVVSAWPRRHASTPAPLSAGAVLTALVLPFAALDAGAGTDLAGGLTLVAAAAAAGVAVNARRPLRAVAVGGSVLAALLGTVLLGADRAEPSVWVAASWTTIAVALIGAAAFARSARTVLVSAGTTIAIVTAFIGLIGQTLGVGPVPAVITLLGTGAAHILFGAVRQSRLAVGGGVAAIVLAAIDLAAAHDVHVVEAYTLPIAAALLVGGLLARVGRPGLTSWAWTAPAAVVALLPPAATTIHDAGVTRLIATAAGALLVVLLGARFRLAAPLVLGAATEIMLAAAQLVPYAVGAPRWITLAVAGVLLLALGVAFEAARRGATTARRWYAALS